MGKEQWPAGESRTPEQRRSETRAHTGGRFRTLEEGTRAELERKRAHDVGSPHRGPPPDRGGHRGHRRSRADAGSTRGAGCGCMPLWGFVISLLLVTLVGTTVPMSTLIGSDTFCGDLSALECVTNSVTLLERSFEQFEDPEALLDQEPGNPHEPENPFEEIESY